MNYFRGRRGNSRFGGRGGVDLVQVMVMMDSLVEIVTESGRR